MARFNEILVGRYNRYMQKLLSMKGQASLVSLSDEMMPVLPVFIGTENRYLEGWDRFCLAVTVTAVAAQPSAAMWRNPAGSNVIAVIESIIVVNIDVAQNLQLVFGKATADLATVDTFTTLGLDLRGRQASTVILSHQNAALPGTGPPNTIWRVPLAATPSVAQNFIQNENQELPMPPGNALAIASFANNTRLDASVTWRERFLEDSERA